MDVLENIDYQSSRGRELGHFLKTYKAFHLVGLISWAAMGIEMGRLHDVITGH
jgi:hypothetical protein